jgi:DNA polymerase-4
MEALGILTGQDLRDRPLEFLQRHFGSYADYLYGAARGIDHRPVRAHRIAKSVGAERTFENDLSDRTALQAALERVVDAAWTRIDRSGVTGRTVTLKLRHSDFRTITRARSTAHPIVHRAEFLAIGLDLLEQQLPVSLGVRLLGLTLSGLSTGDDGAQSGPVQVELPL